MKETLSDIGEEELLRRLKKFVGAKQIEDDTAEIDYQKKKLIINNDVLVENVHFSNETTAAEDVGWKAVSTNISDLTCSGAKNLGITIGLILPPETEWAWIENVYLGMQKALDHFGGKFLGGDCSKGKDKVLSITAIGSLGPLRLHRANAVHGDLLLASGPHGLSRLGLGLLLSEKICMKSKLTASLKKQAIKAHQRPNAPIEALIALESCKPSELPWRAAGTDSSDGLFKAIESICLSSQCQAILDKDKLPKAPGWPKGNLWDEWCLNGGEDFELIVSLPAKWAHEMIQTFPSSYLIGCIKSGPPMLTWTNGEEIKTNNRKAFKHF